MFILVNGAGYARDRLKINVSLWYTVLFYFPAFLATSSTQEPSL